MSKLNYPQFQWPTSGWWFTAISAVLGIVLLFVPAVSSFNIIYRLLLFVFMASLPFIFILIIHVGKKVRVLVLRALCYDLHIAKILELEEILQETQRQLVNILQERQNKRAFQIAYCYSIMERTFIAIKKKPGPSVPPGVKVSVIDHSDEVLIGAFTLIEEKNGHYICEKSGYIEPVWLGYIKQSGSAHSEAPQESVAYVITSNTGDDDD